MELICNINSFIECNNCKDVFTYYSKRKYEILNSLPIFNSVDDTPSSTLDTDNSCMWNMGSYRRRNMNNKLKELEVSSNKFFKCKNCRILEYLVEIGSGAKDQRSFPIFFKCIDITSAELSEVKNVGSIKHIINNTIYLDYFTNGIIINWYLDTLYRDTKELENKLVLSKPASEVKNGLRSWTMSPVYKNYYSFICNNNGYKISDNISSIDFDKIPNNKILSILYQLGGLLTKLEDYNFCIHGGIHTLFTIDSSYNLLLKDVSKCSIKIKDNTISPYDILNYQEKYNIKIVKYESLNNVRNLYRLSNLKGVINSNITGSVRSSLNLYLILYYLLSFKNISNYIYGYEETYKIWNNLWIASDFESLNFSINDLENFRLREDALDFYMKEITKIK